MSFWDQVTDFAEGSWEQVSAGASEFLGEWAGNGFKSKPDDKKQAEQAQLQQRQQQAAMQQQQAQQQAPVFMGLSKKELAIGGAFVVTALLLVTR